MDVLRAVLLRAGSVVAAGLIGGGCVPSETVRIGATDPAADIPAMQDAARAHDLAAVPALVDQLDSDDPAIRFYAIQSLRELTGNTFDYRYYDDAERRRPAVARWRRWLRERGT